MFSQHLITHEISLLDVYVKKSKIKQCCPLCLVPPVQAGMGLGTQHVAVLTEADSLTPCLIAFIHMLSL